MEIEILASSSKGNAYIIRDGEHSILIDPGIPIFELKKRSNFSLSGIELCLLSHEHKDHSKSIKDIADMAIPCAMSAGTLKNVNFNDGRNLPFILESEREFKFKRWSVIPFSVVHDSAEPLGFLILTPSKNKICFATDTAYLVYKFEGVTHWMIECNYSYKILKQNRELPKITKDRIVLTHFELENVKKFFKMQDLSKTKQVYIIHLSDDNSDPLYFVREVESITGLPVYTI